MNILENLEKQWGVHKSNPHTAKPSQILDLIYAATKCNNDDNHCTVNEKLEDLVSNTVEALNELKNENDETTIIRINRVLEMIHYAKATCYGIHRISYIMNPANIKTENVDTSIFRFNQICLDDANKFQKFLLYILNVMYEFQYRKYGQDVYTKVKFKGQDTYAWKKVDTIEKIVYSFIKKETNFDQFLNATSSGSTIRMTIDYLSNCQDSQFSQLDKDRTVFSFRNGIYHAKQNRFIKYCDAVISKNTVACKYFDLEFETKVTHWNDVKTPILDSIFIHQKLEPEVINWMYVLTGRLIYEINEFDGWQVIPFLQGQAGTGKSTFLLNVCKMIFDDDDVGILSNNIQRQFGLSDLADKLMFIAPEIKRDFKMEQGEFQSIVSGDKVAIAVKYKQSRFENWKIPGVLAGNESPDFIDNSGSVQRRMVIFKFNERVKNGDIQLGKKLRSEMHNIIKKCNGAYLEMAKLCGNKNIWEFLPEYFKRTQSELAQATNPLIHFLMSGKLVYGSGYYIPNKIFIQLFNEHCSENNYKKAKWNSDFYKSPFDSKGIKVKTGQKLLYKGEYLKGTFFIGVGIESSHSDSDTE